jgi:hypothetical protein
MLDHLLLTVDSLMHFFLLRMKVNDKHIIFALER